VSAFSVLIVTRDPYPADPNAPTMGVVTADGLAGPVYSLEDPWRDNAPGVSCVPEGDYGLVYVMSNRLGHETPRLLNVPGRSGVLIHGGNTAKDTTGCLLVGRVRGIDLVSIHACAPAIEAVNRWLLRALRSGPAVCRIVRAPAPVSPSPEILTA
jgi:hypothetical protein